MESRGRGGHGRGRGRGGNGQRHNSRGFRNLTPYQRQLVKKKTEKNQRSNVRRKYFKQIEKHDDGENGDHQAIEMDDEQQSEFLHKLLMGDEDKQVSKGENTKKSLNGNESDRGENDNDDDEDIDSDVSSSNSSSLNQKSSTSKIKKESPPTHKQQRVPRSRHNHQHPYSNIIAEQKQRKLDRIAEKKAREEEFQRKQKQIEECEKKRKQTFKKLNKKTKKGQPKMANHIDHLLQKIKNT